MITMRDALVKPSLRVLFGDTIQGGDLHVLRASKTLYLEGRDLRLRDMPALFLDLSGIVIIGKYCIA